jgi:hypothetical protein
MKFYILYLTGSLLTSLLVVFYLGISAGFANYLPILALLGCILLFTIASPLIILSKKLGLIIGLISTILILPYSLIFYIIYFLIMKVDFR